MISLLRGSWLYFAICAAATVAVGSTGAPSNPNARSPKKHTAPQVVYDLSRAETTKFSSPAARAMSYPILCDGDGNIYVHYLTSLRTLEMGYSGPTPPGYVTGVFPDNKELVRYSLPTIPDYQPLISSAFAVAVYGTVYRLAITSRSEHTGRPKPVVFIVKYNRDGTVDSYHRVSGVPGEHIQPLHIAVFGNGHFLLSGTTWKGNSPKTVVLGTFSGIFDEDGDFITRIKLGEAELRAGAKPANSQSMPSGQPRTSVRARAEELQAEAKNPVGLESSTISFGLQDGDVYVLQGTSEATVYAVSPAGTIDREFRLKPPEPGLSPVQMAPAGVSYLFIYYSAIGVADTTSSPGEASYITVLNSATGQVAAVYRMPKAGSGFAVPACADSSDSFLFLGASKDNHLEVVRYDAN